jgi:hypothetical protein
MREYGGSTPFSDEELDQYHSFDPDDQEAVLHVQALELAEFIAHFIREEKLPRPIHSNGMNSGGVSILTWSVGSASVLSLLANISTLSDSVNTLLESHLRTVILYGESRTFGYQKS